MRTQQVTVVKDYVHKTKHMLGNAYRKKTVFVSNWSLADFGARDDILNKSGTVKKTVLTSLASNQNVEWSMPR